MTWDLEECFYEYQEGSTYLLKKLGLTQLDHRKNIEELFPYYNQIIKYLNKELMCNCEDSIKARIEKIIELSDHGAKMICLSEDQPIWDWDPEEIEILVNSNEDTEYQMYLESGQPIKYTVTKTKNSSNYGENAKLIFNAPENSKIKITLDQNYLRSGYDSEDWPVHQRLSIQEQTATDPEDGVIWDENTEIGDQYVSSTNVCIVWLFSEGMLDQSQTNFFTITVENNESEPPQPKDKTRTQIFAKEEVKVDTDSELYIPDRFIYSWADLLGTLCLRLKFQYAHLFKQEVDDTCGCNCGHGETEEDYESWVSGVYPEDYEYDRTNYYRTNTNWGTEADRLCNCYKKNQ